MIISGFDATLQNEATIGIPSPPDDCLLEAAVNIRLPNGEWSFDPDKPLGPAGGFGEVFEGRGAGGEVAVKRLKVAASAEAHRELRIAGDLLGRQLDWVIPIFDAGPDEASGLYFVVMARAEGSLQQVLHSSKTLPEGLSVEIMKSICRGLLEVSDIVHRDLKPGNVLVHGGRWKLSDFGIARFVEEATSSETLRDFLSPPYAAPEQWELERATSATDVYAMGCLCHTLLAGAPPFPGPTREDFKAQHLEEVAPALDQASPGLRTVVTRMLRKAPDARPSVQRVLDELESLGRDARAGAGASALADVAASIIEEDARQEAEAQTRARRLNARLQLAAEARGVLNGLMRELWDRIETQAPVAELSGQSISLGSGTLSWKFAHELLPEDAFPHSGWDVVAGAVIGVTQSSPVNLYMGRSASLWYVRLPQEREYRWVEVSYMRNMAANAPDIAPFGLIDVSDADLAASNVTHLYQHASRVLSVEEDFDAFCERWMGWFALAAQNKLGHPPRLPEN